MKKITSVSVLVILLLSLVLISCNKKSSEENITELPEGYPKKSLEVIVPFGAGGGADIAVRLISKYAEEHYGESIIISNVTGGSGVIGRTQMVTSKPDGYTIGFVGPQNTNDKLILAGIQYDYDSFVPIAQIGTDTHIFIVRKGLGVDNINDLISMLKSAPGEYTFGLGGAWTSHEFLLEKFKAQADVDVRRMPFNSGSATVNAVASGDCDIAAVFVSEALAQIEAGNVIPLGVTYQERVKAAPSIPTVAEEGFEFYHEFFRSLAAPAGTPQPIIDYIADCFEKASKDEAYLAEAEKAGLMPQFIGDEFPEVFEKSHQEFNAILLEAADGK